MDQIYFYIKSEYLFIYLYI